MARWRKVETGTWTDERFQGMTKSQPSGQMLWLYLLSGPRTTTFPGLIVAREAVAADDLGWSLEGFRQAFAEASSKGMAKADWKAGLILLPRALLDSAGEPRETARPESPNVVRSWAKSWDEIPECRLKTEYLRTFETFCEALGEGFTKAFREAFRKALAKASANQEKEQEKEQEQERESVERVAPLALVPPPTDAQVVCEVINRSSEIVLGTRAPVAKAPRSDYQDVVDLFDRLFCAQTGAKPTWGAAQGAMVKGLLAKHSATEVQRRMRLLFDEQGPAFLKPPYDLKTFVANFDKLAQPQRQAGGRRAVDPNNLTADDLGAWAEELRRRGQ